MRSYQPRLSFQAKVVVPVAALMVLLLGLTMWIVNQRFTHHFEREIRQTLVTASTILTNSEAGRGRELARTYSLVADAPKVKSACQTLHSPTIKVSLQELLTDMRLDWISFYGRQAKSMLATATAPGSAVELNAMQKGFQPAIDEAIATQEPVPGYLANQGVLFDVACIPVVVEEDVVGVLVFGTKVPKTVAEEFKRLTHTDLVFILDGSVAFTSMTNTEIYPDLTRQFAAAVQPAVQEPLNPDDPAPRLFLGEERFLYRAGVVPSRPALSHLGYLLLYSDREPLADLRETQRLLLVTSVVMILIGVATVFGLVRTQTEPLRALKDAADAIGRGDFGHRAPVRSNDECGDLARAFNNMTENLGTSRSELEKTVQTLRTTRAQLAQSEKLSVIGEFVAGVAHELNNPLTCVIGFSELLEHETEDPRVKNSLKLIVTSSQRCHRIVQNLLAFARQRPSERKPVDLADLMEGTLSFAGYELRTSNVSVTRKFVPNLPAVMADPHQIQQVFLNLINNARQALEAFRPDGLLEISTSVEGDRVCLSVKDNGPGISPENRAKIFEPFFTTKEVGKGTGLGLSLSTGIIREHGGELKLVSAPGDGATFIIELPVFKDAQAQDEETQHLQRAAVSKDEGRGRSVLVVDDEESVLHLTSQILLGRGYTVEAVPDGESAFARLAVKRFDVILCDWKMPGLAGRHFYERVLDGNPRMAERFLFMTGDVLNERAEDFLKGKGRKILAKPFSVRELCEAVRVVASTK